MKHEFKQGIYHNQIEAVLGLQLYCCIDTINGTLQLNEQKIFRMNAYIDKGVYMANSKYFFDFWKYLIDNYNTILDTIVKFVPEDKSEYVLIKCTQIVATSFKDDDIKILRKIQHALGIDSEWATEMANKIINDVKFELELEDYVKCWGKYGFIKKMFLKKWGNSIESPVKFIF